MTWLVPARIETDRLILRPYAPEDAEALSALILANLAHLETYMEWVAHEPLTLDQRRAWIAKVAAAGDAGEDFTFGMFDRDGALVGGTGFHVRTEPARLAIGYWIDAAHQGRGLVTEASAALTRVALELAGARAVDIEHAASNARSAAIPERLGYARLDEPSDACFDAGATEAGVTWRATAATLGTAPLASTPRPRVFDALGEALVWPA